MKKNLLLLTLFFSSFFLYAQDKSKTQFPLPKGSGFLTPTFNLKQSSSTNSLVLGVQIDDSYKMDYGINFNWGVFIKKDFSLGLQVSYNNSREDLTYYPGDVYTVSNYYANMLYLTPNIRNYFGAGRFKGFVQTNLGVGFGKGLKRTYADENDNKTDYESLEFTVAIVPGLAVFVANFMTVELSINLIGYTSSFKKSILNDTYESTSSLNKVDFDINVLTMRIGLGFYLDAIKKKDSKPK